MSGSHQQHKSSPCGACRFLRRKCVKDACVKDACVFAPFFDSTEGAMAHFAAVHKVFGASNASKMLMAVPQHRRPEAVMALCYEAVARARDPVYGCVAHVFNLQQQVVNLQAELAFIQARLSILQCSPQPRQQGTPNSTHFQSLSDISSTCISPQFDPSKTSDMASFCRLLDEHLNNYGDLSIQAIGYEFLSK